MMKNEWWTDQGRLFQTDGPVQGNDLLPDSFLFTRGMTKVWVSNAEHNPSSVLPEAC